MVEDGTRTCMNLWIEVATGVRAWGAIIDQHYTRPKKGGETTPYRAVDCDEGWGTWRCSYSGGQFYLHTLSVPLFKGYLNVYPSTPYTYSFVGWPILRSTRGRYIYPPHQRYVRFLNTQKVKEIPMKSCVVGYVHWCMCRIWIYLNSPVWFWGRKTEYILEVPFVWERNTIGTKVTT